MPRFQKKSEPAHIPLFKMSLDAPIDGVGDSPSFGEFLPDDRPDPEDACLRSEKVVLARDLLHSLPRADRRLLQLRHFERLSVAQTARRLSLTAGKVRRRERQALLELRRRAETLRRGATER
jgi:RNA polymerase sigma factor (sigma-70 family)